MPKKPVLDYESAIEASARRKRRWSASFAGGMLLFIAASLVLGAAEPVSVVNIIAVVLLTMPGVAMLILAARAPDVWLCWLGTRAFSLLLCYIGMFGTTSALLVLITDGANGWEWIAFGVWVGMGLLIVLLGVQWWPRDVERE